MSRDDSTMSCDDSDNKINMIFLDLPGLNKIQFEIENVAKAVFSRRFLGYVI